MRNKEIKILVTGSSGYIGGRLVPELVGAGFDVRVLIREPLRFEGRKWLAQVEVVEGDKFKPESFLRALVDIDVVFYMISNWGVKSEDFQTMVKAAEDFSHAAYNAGVKKIIYLGGIAHEFENGQTHQQFRAQIGDALRASAVKVIELRSSIIIGSGSVYFEIIRNLVEKSPFMLLPKSFAINLHPIAAYDVLAYLIKSIGLQEASSLTIDIGVSNRMNLCEMLSDYASVRGIRRWIVLTPGMPNWVASFWINFITPIPIRAARPLLKDLREEKLQNASAAEKYYPDIFPLSFSDSLKRSLEFLQAGQVETAWSDTLSEFGGGESLVEVLNRGGIVFERRQNICPAPASSVFDVLQRLGGKEGWLFLNWAWKLRGFLDRMTGGVGLQRGRRTPNELRVGDTVDFWRVEARIPDRLLRFYAEMQVPGQAWLEFELKPIDEGHTRITQMAFFAPKGLTGLAYWYLLYPIHKILFTGLIREISEKSIAFSSSP